ncbi:MAG: peptidoglycan-binding protein [Acidimicrobiia bacterium]|nr:peptidoglycan-binding protein [Acidimicrobiia bacterium]
MRTWWTRTSLVLVVAVVATACGGSSALAPPTSATTVVASTLAPTTTTTLGEFIELTPNGPAFVTQGDRSEFVEALQFYLVCTGHERISEDGASVTVDGVYGPITSAVVAYVQAEMRRIPSGSPDEATFASLARRCGATRTIDFPADRADRRVGGNVAPSDDEVLIVAGEIGRTLTVEIAEGAVQFSVRNEAGNVLHEERDGSRWSAVLSEDGEYRIRVIGATTQSYSLLIDYPPPPRVEIDFGPLVLAPDGMGVAKFGDEPTDVIDLLITILGEPTTDSGWEGGSIAGCSGFNRHLRWVIDPAVDDGKNRAVFFAHFSDEGFDDTSFAQYEYISLDPEHVDIGARELATAEGLSLGSSLTEYVGLYGEPLILNRDLGFADFNAGMVVGIDLTTEDDPADFTERVWYLSAGQDGCADYDS